MDEKERGGRANRKGGKKEEMNKFFLSQQISLIFSRTRRRHGKPDTSNDSLSRSLSNGAIHVALNFPRLPTLPAERELFISFLGRRHPPPPNSYRTLSPKWRTAEYKYAARKSGVGREHSSGGRDAGAERGAGLRPLRSVFRPTLPCRRQRGGGGRLAGLGRSAAPPTW